MLVPGDGLKVGQKPAQGCVPQEGCGTPTPAPCSPRSKPGRAQSESQPTGVTEAAGSLPCPAGARPPRSPGFVSATGSRSSGPSGEGRWGAPASWPRGSTETLAGGTPSPAQRRCELFCLTVIISLGWCFLLPVKVKTSDHELTSKPPAAST